MKFELHVNSPAVDIRNLVVQAKRLSKALGIPDNQINWPQIEASVASFIQPGVKAENFKVQIIFEKDHITLQSLKFDIYGGKVGLSGWLDSSSELPTYHADLDIQNVSLARMMRRNTNDKAIEGNLFLVTKLDGAGFSPEALKANLKGDGAFTMTNGEFQTFDVLGSLGAIAQFTGLSQYISGTTRFSDVNGKFVIGGGRLQTDHILIYSTDFDIDAEGSVDFDTNLNFRLNTVLSSELSRRINGSLEEGARMGPLPIMLTGKLASPSVRPDPVLIQEFIGSLLSGKLGNVLAKQGWLKKNMPAAGTDESAAEQGAPAQTPQQELLQTGATLLESLFAGQEGQKQQS